MTAGSSASSPDIERFLSNLAHDLRNLLEGLEVALFRDPAAG